MSFNPLLRAFTKQSRTIWIAASACSFLAMTPTSYAQEDTSYTYAPDTCEFSVSFPEEPHTKKTCEGGDNCFDVVEFNHVFELSSTVKTRVICNEIDSDIYETYSGRVMEATLKAMTDPLITQTFETSFRENEYYKQAGLVGEGLVGRTPTLYIGQLWIGHKSALSVEAELIGAQFDEADTMFSDILRSVHYKDEKPEESEEAPAPETSP